MTSWAFRLLSVSGLMGVLTIVVNAQVGGGNKNESKGQSVELPGSPIGGSFIEVAKKLMDLIATIALPVAAIMVVVGAIQMMAAAGSAEKISAGRKTITYAAVGYAVVFLASTLIDLVAEVVR